MEDFGISAHSVFSTCETYLTAKPQTVLEAMSMKIKNIAKSEILVLKEQISYQEGQVVSKTLAQNPAVSITLF